MLFYSGEIKVVIISWLLSNCLIYVFVVTDKYRLSAAFLKRNITIKFCNAMQTLQHLSIDDYYYVSGMVKCLFVLFYNILTKLYVLSGGGGCFAVADKYFDSMYSLISNQLLSSSFIYTTHLNVQYTANRYYN